jgi:ectoine hydroxylase-related dioxygenase (phytanoyl-CoA dioxygenase family)
MLEQDQVDTFQRQGAVLLKGVFREFVDGARAAIEENIANPSWRERTYRPDDGGQAFFQDYVVWDRFDGYRALVRGSRMPAMAAQLMGSRTARVFHDHILVKEPGNSVVTPWHQDQPYYLCDGRQTVSFWVPLDDIPRERTIEYVAGSHLWGVDYKPQRFDGRTCSRTTPAKPCRMWRRCATSSRSSAGRWNPAMRSPFTSARCTGRRRTGHRAAGG